MPIMNKVGVAP